MTALYTLPQRFYDDHVERDLPAGELVDVKARTYTVELNAEEYAELLDDAEHYADPSMRAELGRDYFGLTTSAAATAKALREAGPPPALEGAVSQ